MLIVTITFLIVKEQPLYYSNETPFYSDQSVKTATTWEYWETWAATGYIGAGLGGYFGLLFQNQKYGGQLFIQQRINQTRNNRIKQYAYRLGLILLILSPAIAVCVVVNEIQPKSPSDDPIFSAPQSKTLFFFYNIVVYFLTAFVVFAFADSIFLRVGLFDRAPTPDRIVFNKEDDRLLL